MRRSRSPIVAVGRLVVLLAAFVLLSGPLLVADDKNNAGKGPKERSLTERKKALNIYLTTKTGRAAKGTYFPKGEPWVWARQGYMAVPKQDPKKLAAWMEGIGNALNMIPKVEKKLKDQAKEKKP
jgi:hypothetical protein